MQRKWLSGWLRTALKVGGNMFLCTFALRQYCTFLSTFLLMLTNVVFLIVCFFSKGYGCILMLWIWWWQGRETWDGYSSRKKLEGEIQEKGKNNKTRCKSCWWKMPIDSIGGIKLWLSPSLYWVWYISVISLSFKLGSFCGAYRNLLSKQLWFLLTGYLKLYI